LEDNVYYVFKRWRIGFLKKIRLSGEFTSLDEAREFCCKQINLHFNKESFDENFKMTFWDRTKKITYDII